MHIPTGAGSRATPDYLFTIGKARSRPHSYVEVPTFADSLGAWWGAANQLRLASTLGRPGRTAPVTGASLVARSLTIDLKAPQGLRSIRQAVPLPGSRTFAASSFNPTMPAASLRRTTANSTATATPRPRPRHHVRPRHHDLDREPDLDRDHDHDHDHDHDRELDRDHDTTTATRDTRDRDRDTATVDRDTTATNTSTAPDRDLEERGRVLVPKAELSLRPQARLEARWARWFFRVGVLASLCEDPDHEKPPSIPAVGLLSGRPGRSRSSFTSPRFETTSFATRPPAPARAASFSSAKGCPMRARRCV